MQRGKIVCRAARNYPESNAGPGKRVKNSVDGAVAADYDQRIDVAFDGISRDLGSPSAQVVCAMPCRKAPNFFLMIAKARSFRASLERALMIT